MKKRSNCFDISKSVYRTTSCPYGVSAQDWTRRWWRWLLSIPKSINPLTDSTGEYNVQSQIDPDVFFLAGTFGGSLIRKCAIPYGKAILFPVINYESCLSDEPLLTNGSQLENKCKEEIDNVGELYCQVDHQEVDLSECRIHSGAFEIDLPTENCLSVRAGETIMASDGYWLFLHPPTRGKHLIQSFGSCLSGKIKITCTFKLTIY